MLFHVTFVAVVWSGYTVVCTQQNVTLQRLQIFQSFFATVWSMRGYEEEQVKFRGLVIFPMFFGAGGIPNTVESYQ